MPRQMLLQRLYLHNFRCFENFEFRPEGQTASLLIGKNGSGKSSLMQALALFQAIGRGRVRLKELEGRDEQDKLIGPADFTRGRSDIPMRFEIEVVLREKTYAYSLVLELPEKFRELRVLHERLTVDGETIFTRDKAEITIPRTARGRDDTVFSMDWHLIALPVIQDATAATALQSLCEWMASMVLLSPTPQTMRSEALGSNTAIERNASNLPDWLAGLLESYPAAYATIVSHLQQVIPDLQALRFERLGRDARALIIQFVSAPERMELAFSALSDGEKCFFIGAVLLAAIEEAGPLLAFWDEPDNNIAPHEVNQLIVALKRSFFHNKGQLIISSHNPQAIQCFSDDSTWVMGRRSHLEPTRIRCLDELQSNAEGTPQASQSPLLQRLLDGDLEPWR